MRLTSKSLYETIIVGDLEVDRRYTREGVVVLKVDTKSTGMTQSQALCLAANLIETVQHLQQSQGEGE